jgi:synaptosomal-associated protein 25
MGVLQEQEAAMLRVAEKTTADARRVLKIAEDTREIGVNTLVNLHMQGEQIRRTHHTAVQVDQELSKVRATSKKQGGAEQAPSNGGGSPVMEGESDGAPP